MSLFLTAKSNGSFTLYHKMALRYDLFNLNGVLTYTISNTHKHLVPQCSSDVFTILNTEAMTSSCGVGRIKVWRSSDCRIFCKQSSTVITT